MMESVILNVVIPVGWNQTIPGISLQIATCIASKYHNVSELIKAYIEIETSKQELLLSEIMVTEKRKVGKSLSKKIYQIMFGKDCNK